MLYLYVLSFQILAVGADPAVTRFDINGKILSQIQCAPQSAFSVSLHSSGVCTLLNYYRVSIRFRNISLFFL